MPSPTQSLATLRPDLGGSLEEFDLAMDRKGFISLSVAPVIETAVQAGTFGRIPVEQLLAARDTKRAPGGAYNRGNWTFTPDSYATEEHGWEEPVDQRQARMYANYFDAELVATRRAYDAVLRDAEQRMADKIFNTSTWTGSSLTTAVGTAWSSTSSTPVTNVEDAVKKVWANSGLWPNALVLTKRAYRNLRFVSQMIDMAKYQGFQDVRPGRIGLDHMSAVFDLPHIIVAGSSKNSANEGQAATFASLWSDSYAMVCVVAETNDIREPCIARTIHWGEDGSTIGGTVEEYWEEKVRSDVKRVRHDVCEKVMYTECGHLLSNIT